MKQEPYPGTQAVQRAIRLLKAFTAETPEMRLRDLAQGVGLNKTTAFRLLSALESAEMIERAADGEVYRLGPEMLRLGSQALDQSGLHAAGHAVLAQLAEKTRETVSLEVLVGGEVLIVDEVVGDHVVGAMPSRGTRWPAHATSTGKVLLAHLDEGELAARLAQPLKAFAPRTITDRAALARDLARVRTRGYATCVEELEPGFVAVAAPVRSASGGVVAALSVAGPKVRLRPSAAAAIARRLPAAADTISRRLGWKEHGRTS